MTTIITNRVRVFALALLSALLMLPAARAQAQTAVITGKVTSESGQPVDSRRCYVDALARRRTSSSTRRLQRKSVF